MTKKERLEAIISGNLSEEVIEECKKELEKLCAADEKRKSKLTERQQENAEVEKEILEFVSGTEGVTVEEIGKALPYEFARQRYTGICTKLVKEGKLKVEDRKFKNKGMRKVYFVQTFFILWISWIFRIFTSWIF